MNPIAARKFQKKVEMMKPLTFKKWKIIRGDMVMKTFFEAKKEL